MPCIENVNRWIEKVEIDYFTQFIKAWIPFNAWYNMNFPNLDSDRAIINEIKRSHNTFKSSIISFLNNYNNESFIFKNYIGDLHKALLEALIKNSNDMVISFEEIIIEKNAVSQINYNYRGVSYYLDRIDTGRNFTINIALKNIRDGSNIFYFQQNSYDFTQVENDRDFRNLSQERQSIIRNKYCDINPYKPISLLTTSNEQKIDIGSYKFINDTDLIAKGIIEVLYLLRCSLFHGEVVPNETASLVFKYAYEILKMILDKIR